MFTLPRAIPWTIIFLWFEIFSFCLVFKFDAQYGDVHSSEQQWIWKQQKYTVTLKVYTLLLKWMVFWSSWTSAGWGLCRQDSKSIWQSYSAFARKNGKNIAKSICAKPTCSLSAVKESKWVSTMLVWGVLCVDFIDQL